ncbi:hypothetical protein C5C07_20345 [Haloferax sp. Atlit-4N]|uniref:Uncharacterized protein n=2 Tax=Haloferax TaxID=2251 RepID=A0A871BLC6_HALGI|nr:MULTISPECIES: hypothetical protein [Haloferax]QOS13544.1 uncharacterized protein HfgLR_21635 [Haloferax gibbonsii]RDZ39473.1 hypothetical protein C5B86_18870 [Haloferax sp. Atlit-19N]RDZ49326.1 hypothetical protein C5C07_20345 [Haloferax sp. Atlit-4N]GGC71162.1 hypothetical protein GCM10007209_36360 [Haloferax sulfurifontis]
MDDAELLRRELRAARDELVRKRADEGDDPVAAASQLPLMPERDDEFLRLALMSVNELETHIERLERDLDDLKNGIDHPDD